MDPDQLLQSLGLHLGLPNLRFDANGCARLAIQGAPALNFERDASGAIHLYSVLANIPPDGREVLYTQMLQGNLFGTSTAGGALALDDARGEILLCRSVMADLGSAQMFAAYVDAFASAAEDWQRRLAAPRASEPTTAPLETQGLMEHFLRG